MSFVSVHFAPNEKINWHAYQNLRSQRRQPRHSGRATTCPLAEREASLPEESRWCNGAGFDKPVRSTVFHAAKQRSRIALRGIFRRHAATRCHHWRYGNMLNCAEYSGVTPQLDAITGDMATC
jgi:hypothetical protein